MPRPQVDQFWRERIHAITENAPGKGPGPVLRELEEFAAQEGRPDVPSSRTIGRIQAEYRLNKNLDKSIYREFRWPESMECGDLPWEASHAALEAIRYVHELMNDAHGFPRVSHVGRPLLGVVRWFWRVSLARPEATVQQRWNWALQLFLLRSEVAQGDVRSLEMTIAEVSLQAGQTWFGEGIDEHQVISISSDGPWDSMFGWNLTHRRSDGSTNTLRNKKRGR